VLFRFGSLADYERATSSLNNDPDFRRASEKRSGSFKLFRVSKTAKLLPYASERRLEAELAQRPQAPRQYKRGVMQCAPGTLPAAAELIGRLVDIIEATSPLRLATGYETLIGPSDELTDIWVQPSDVPLVSASLSDAHADLFAPLREITADEEFDLLNPLPYSPLR
jgi:hypothetical protein